MSGWAAARSRPSNSRARRLHLLVMPTGTMDRDANAMEEGEQDHQHTFISPAFIDISSSIHPYFLRTETVLIPSSYTGLVTATRTVAGRGHCSPCRRNSRWDYQFPTAMCRRQKSSWVARRCRPLRWHPSGLSCFLLASLRRGRRSPAVHRDRKKQIFHRPWRCSR